MMEPIEEKNFRVFNDPLQLYSSQLEDIKNAKKYIYIETYRFNNDAIGLKFRDALVRKAQEGVEIKLLLDSWGTPNHEHFFADLIKFGAEVRFFKKLKFFFDYFTKNHKRNHRKLLLIDDAITYIGSSNFTGYSLHWREMVLKITGNLTKLFKKTFIHSFELYKKYYFTKFAQQNAIRYKDWEIIQDMPSIYRQKIKRKYEYLIKRAKKSIIIETPYFLPGYKLRKALMDAAQRDVDVKIAMPLHSDVKLIDILRNKYLGQLYQKGVHLLMYKPSNLHSKLFMVDNETFMVGSANFDYRSFRYQYEISLLGKDSKIAQELTVRALETQADCVPFDYNHWLRRPKLQKIFEWLLLPFRHLL